MGRLILNCDLGENEPLELTRRLMARIDAASIGCGVHAGNSAKTRSAIELAQDAGLRIGAHPGLPTAGGRGSADLRPPVLRELLEKQVGDFRSAAAGVGARVDYIKLHGSLYHAVERDEALAEAYLDFLADHEGIVVFAFAGGRFQKTARSRGLEVFEEAFADRGYVSATQLQPRGRPGALLTEPEAVVARIRSWLETGRLPLVGGGEADVRADTLCVHGDTEGSLAVLDGLRQLLGSG